MKTYYFVVIYHGLTKLVMVGELSYMYMTGIKRQNQGGGLVYKLSYYSWESNCWFETELGNKHPPENSSSVQTPPFPQPRAPREGKECP